MKRPEKEKNPDDTPNPIVLTVDFIDFEYMLKNYIRACKGERRSLRLNVRGSKLLLEESVGEGSGEENPKEAVRVIDVITTTGSGTIRIQHSDACKIVELLDIVERGISFHRIRLLVHPRTVLTLSVHGLSIEIDARISVETTGF